MLKKYYHGTDIVSARNILENGIDLNAGRTLHDFGKGFYTTEDYMQAARWAGNSKEAAVIAFYCDTDKLDGVVFNGFTDEWKEAIYSNRVEDIDPYADKDYVEGPLADGKARQLAARVRHRQSSKKEFFREISRANIGSQVNFKSLKAVESLKMGHIVKGDDHDEKLSDR